MNTGYAQTEPSRAEIEALPGPTLLEFGAPWCGWCRAAQPLIQEALASYGNVRHIKVEDGSGRPLGRSFGIKLWPTLVFLRDGTEETRAVRPQSVDQVEQALNQIAATVTVPWKTYARLSKRVATARKFLSRLMVRSTSLRRR